ncbi:hypothetical protein FJZ31_37430 [Candidatus Poribacteria bacterium]|nr:hypothetical protein [Candidatus Poribacteria bacterium]
MPYQLAEQQNVTIFIYRLNGEQIRSLELGTQPGGEYITKGQAAYWDGRDSTGQRVGSGIYFYQLQAGKFTATRRMAILK